MSSNKRSVRRDTRDFTDATIFDVLSSLNTPRSLAVWLLYNSGEHDQLVELSCDPLHYQSPHTFRDNYAATSLLSKADFLRTSFNREQKALDKFLKAEEQCKSTNRLVCPFAPSGYFPPEALHPLVPRVRSKIESILGRFNAEELIERSDWGPGVSTLLKGPLSVKPNKYQQETGMSREVYDVLWPLLDLAYPGWHQNVLVKTRATVQAGNVVCTVPKNSKTDRVIAVEPGWNLWFQKGAGKMIRQRLLRQGCNLNDQRINQELSRLAFSLGLATVDFSSASDTISREVVRLLLPADWYSVLDLLRCKRGTLPDGSVLYWEKFSSMGNGFTFELESLIFLACALVSAEFVGASRSKVSVYGDDVILPAKAYPTFLELTQLLGFTINQAKSFSSGLFYESCGAHWFKGVDVKPFYLKHRVDTVPRIYGVHNSIVHFAHICNQKTSLDARFKQATARLRRSVPPIDFNLVPKHAGDVGFCSNLDHAMTLRTTRVVRMIGVRIRTRAEVAVSLHFDGYGLILDRLRALSTKEDKHLDSGKEQKISANQVPLKTLTKTVRPYTLVQYGKWYNLGEWV